MSTHRNAGAQVRRRRASARASEPAARHERSGAPVTVDELDRALIQALWRDGRTSNRALAKALGVSEATIASRLARLEEAAITRVVALVDMEAFGYEYLAFAKVRVGGRRLADVAQDLTELQESISVTITTGRFDLIVGLLARDRAHLADLLGITVPAVRGVEDVACELGVEVLKYESRWSQLGGAPRPVEPVSASDRVDELDLAIIGMLQVDGRQSNRRIGAKLGVSEGAVRARIKRMQSEGLIRIQAVSDLSAFGIGAHAYVGVTVQGGRVRAVADALVKLDAAPVVIRSLGDFDLLLVLMAADREALVRTILDEIAVVPGVRRTETFESCGTLKHSFTWARLVERAAG